MHDRDQIRLTKLASCAGWAAKLGPGALDDILASVRMPSSPALLVGLGVPDDAAVFQLDGRTTLVQTVDFFPPIVDDPRQYGAIAAANALSDIYAMGGTPLLALAIAGFPDDLPAAVCAAILQGGADVVAEAGAVLGGGHTVSSREPTYGLCVTGVVDLAQLTTKAGAQAGDVLVVTKPLGTGLITTAARADGCDATVLASAVASMMQLNREAAALARACGVHAATDITGFGLAGHGAELARASGVALLLDGAALPALPGALACAADGFIAGGVQRNQAYLEQTRGITGHAALTPPYRALLFDPQTSGGLLLSFAAADADRFVALSAAAGRPAWIIGRVGAGTGIVVRWSHHRRSLEQTRGITGRAALTPPYRALLFDPQTSGRLLLSFAAGRPAWIIGRVGAGAGIVVRWSHHRRSVRTSQATPKNAVQASTIAAPEATAA